MTPRILLSAAAAAVIILSSIAATAPANAVPTTGTIIAHVVNTGADPLSDGVRVDLWRLSADETEYDFSQSYDIGSPLDLDATDVAPGTYRVQFVDPTGLHDSQWYQDQRFFGDGTDVVVTAGGTNDLGTVDLGDRDYSRARISGADRYATAVAVSQVAFDTVPVGGAPVVYLANGANYPDALAAGPAAVRHGGVLLLTPSTSLPSEVKTELVRLHPQRIVVVGGTAAISASVQSALSAYSSTVVRIGGVDRYQTSRLIVQDAFTHADVAFIATGTNFPDALAAAPAAGISSAPVILVNGAAAGEGNATDELLHTLGVTQVNIVGGTAGVSTGIQSGLVHAVGPGGTVNRYAGSNRYDTAVQINSAFFGTGQNEEVFLATGTGFADALAGGPLAAYFHSPLFLSYQDCIPYDAMQSAIQHDTQQFILLGGTVSLSQNVYDIMYCGPEGPTSLSRPLTGASAHSGLLAPRSAAGRGFKLSKTLNP